MKSDYYMGISINECTFAVHRRPVVHAFSPVTVVYVFIASTPAATIITFSSSASIFSVSLLVTIVSAIFDPK
jgi:hypothetical protein